MDIRNELLEAIARGWCHEKTSHIEMNSELANAILQEILLVLSQEIKEAVGEDEKEDTRPEEWRNDEPKIRNGIRDEYVLREKHGKGEI